jgi:hypothetical protein
MASTAAAKAQIKNLPRSATIKIRDQRAVPSGEIEVMPDVGRVHIRNEDNKDYRIRLWRAGSDRNLGIELVLAPHGIITLLIRKDDVFEYSVMNKLGIMDNGNGGGPIRN